MPKNNYNLKQEELQFLREENARLKALLSSHGIDLEEPPVAEQPPAQIESPEPVQLSTDEKIALFRRLFRGRTDVYPLRWESAKGKSGYSPACGNEWKPGICHKPKFKCADCRKRQLLPVTDRVIYNHLAGKHTIGVYPLLNNDSCYFLAVDFDETGWRGDAGVFMQSCQELEIPAALESSAPATVLMSGFFSPIRHRPSWPGSLEPH